MATEIMHSEVEGPHRSSSPSPADKAAKDSNEISLLELLIVILERKRLIFYVTASFALTAVIVALLLPKRYTAAVALLPPQQNSSMAASLTSQLSSLGGMAAMAGGSLGIKNPNDLYIGMLKSRTVEDAMVQRFGLMKEYRDEYASDARKDFERHVTVDGSGKDGLIHISVENKDPDRASELANGYIDEFRKLSEHLAITEAAQRRLFFERQLQQAKEKLVNAEEALKQTEQRTGLIELSGQARALIESAAALRAQIAAKEVQIQGMQTYATGQNSELVQAQRELDAMQAQLSKLGGSDQGAGDGLIVPKGMVPAAGLEYVRKLREVKYTETVFEILARQFEIAKLDEAKQGALVQVVDPAIKPDKRSFPKRSLIVIGATLAGLLVGVLVALLQAGFVQMKANPEVSSKLVRLRSAFSGGRRIQS